MRWLGNAATARYPVLDGIPLPMIDYAHDAAGPLGVSST
jgi:hypothetical protein